MSALVKSTMDELREEFNYIFIDASSFSEDGFEVVMQVQMRILLH
ncbi:hypothetical protein bcere0022_43010 [Bacillus cereus Rock3-44]|nr:hypothetical protein bcere0022_43010 [Bacillus cereus Rock3-44]